MPYDMLNLKNKVMKASNLIILIYFAVMCTFAAIVS